MHTGDVGLHTHSASGSIRPTTFAIAATCHQHLSAAAPVLQVHVWGTNGQAQAVWEQLRKSDPIAVLGTLRLDNQDVSWAATAAKGASGLGVHAGRCGFVTAAVIWSLSAGTIVSQLTAARV